MISNYNTEVTLKHDYWYVQFGYLFTKVMGKYCTALAMAITRLKLIEHAANIYLIIIKLNIPKIKFDNNWCAKFSEIKFNELWRVMVKNNSILS